MFAIAPPLSTAEPSTPDRPVPRPGHWCRRAVLWLAVALPGAALTQAAAALDVPYVPTPQPVVDRMLELAKVKKSDFVMDVGCGDGRMIVSAARDHGARGLGIDIDPKRIAEARQSAEAAGVTDKVEFRVGDLFEADLSQADVLAMYLLEGINLKLRPKILSTMKPGARIVSHAFTMGEWQPDQRETVGSSQILMWVVPARVDGRWQVRPGPSESGFEMTLEQNFQEFSGEATIEGRPVEVRDGRLRGAEISFVLETEPGKTRTFRGRVKDQAIEAVSGSERAWLARRHP